MAAAEGQRGVGGRWEGVGATGARGEARGATEVEAEAGAAATPVAAGAGETGARRS